MDKRKSGLASNILSKIVKKPQKQAQTKPKLRCRTEETDDSIHYEEMGTVKHSQNRNHSMSY